MVARQGRKGAFLARYLASFLVSGLLFVAILIVFLAATNELFVFSHDNIETDEDLLWGAAFGQSHDAYKLARVRYTKPDLMILGSSRMTQFRDVMAPGARFYNAGQVSDAFSTTFRFLTNLYQYHKPKVVILGIDPWWFDPDRQDDCVVDKSVCFRQIDFDYRGLVTAAVAEGLKPRIIRSGQSHDAYKLARVRYTKPDLMILGSSRMTQFRDVMRDDPKIIRGGFVLALSLAVMFFGQNTTFLYFQF